MTTVTNVGEASVSILAILRRGPRSAGNIARTMMGAGLLSKDESSYALVTVTLAALAANGLVRRSGNGKAHHWRLT